MQQIITDRGGRHGDDPASPPTALNGRVFAPPWWSALTPPFTLARRDPQEALQPCAAVIGAPKVSSRRNLVVRARPGERRVSTLKSHSWPTPVGGRAGQGADIRAGFRHMPVAGSRQFAEQRLRLFEVLCVEAFS